MPPKRATASMLASPPPRAPQGRIAPSLRLLGRHDATKKGGWPFEGWLSAPRRERTVAGSVAAGPIEGEDGVARRKRGEALASGEDTRGRELRALRGGAADVRPSASVRALHPVAKVEERAHAAHPGRAGRSWLIVLWRVWERTLEDRVLSVAGGVAFFMLLAIFPGLVALISLYGLVSDPASIEGNIFSLAPTLPGGVHDLIADQLRRVAATKSASLGFGFLFALIIALWSANSGVKALFDALNVVNRQRETRSFVVLNLMSFAFTLGSLLLFAVAIAAIVALPIAIAALGVDFSADLLVRIVRWPLLFFTFSVGLALLYGFGPSRRRTRFRWLTGGSALASFLWIAASAGFSWYVANFPSYNATYGSLGAVAVFMTWLWLSATIVLIGAEFDAETRRHRPIHDEAEG